jgi:hypothetical protein
MAGIALVAILFYATSSVKISTDEVATTWLLGSKSLRWSEIGRISMRGRVLRLHSRDEDSTLFIDSQLDDYGKILNIIFSARPDLLDESENNILSSSRLRNMVILGSGLLITVISIVLFFVFEGFEKIFPLPFLALAAYILDNWFSAPRRLMLENKNLIVGYLFKEESYSVDDISSISYNRRKRKPRAEYINFIQINLRSGKNIQFSLFEHGNAFAYHILKRWHEKAS